MGEIRRPVGHPPKAGAFGRSPGSRENPWALFGYFLSQQKVTPRRGGETRQKISKTSQDCEGSDRRVAVKGNVAINSKSPYPGPRGRHVQEAALRACLEGQTDKTASAWRSRGWVSASLVPAAACHFENTKTGWETVRAFPSARFIAAALIESCCLISGSFARCGGRPGAVRPGPGPD